MKIAYLSPRLPFYFSNDMKKFYLYFISRLLYLYYDNLHVYKDEEIDIFVNVYILNIFSTHHK